MGKVTEVVEGALDKDRNGKNFLRLVLVSAKGTTYKKAVFGEPVAGFAGPGSYEVTWKKNEKGDFNIIGLVKVGGVSVKPSVSGPTKSFNQSSPVEEKRDKSIRCSVALNDAARIISARIAGGANLTETACAGQTLALADKFEEWLRNKVDGKETRTLQTVAKSNASEEEVPF